MKTKYAVLPSLFLYHTVSLVFSLSGQNNYFKQISLKEGLPSTCAVFSGMSRVSYG